jgi:acyl-CoA thioesterase FadM
MYKGITMNLWLRMFRIFLFSRFDSKLDIFAKFNKVFRVWPSDLDVLRHMNNGKYLTIMDLGRMNMLIRCDIAKTMLEKGFFPVLAAATIKFQKSLKLFQHFTLQTQMVGWDAKFFYVEQIFMVGEVVYARAFISARMLNKSGEKYSTAEFLTAMNKNVTMPEMPDYIQKWIASIPA